MSAHSKLQADQQEGTEKTEIFAFSFVVGRADLLAGRPRGHPRRLSGSATALPISLFENKFRFIVVTPGNLLSY